MAPSDVVGRRPERAGRRHRTGPAGAVPKPAGRASLPAVLLDLATVAVLAFVGVRLAGAAGFAVRRGPGRARALAIVGGIRWRHVAPVPLVLAAVLAAAVALVQVPLLSFGWWTALGGVGNPVTGGTERTLGTALEWLVPLVFLTLLLPALPLFAYREEEIFRQGCEHWSAGRRVAKAVWFGLVHAVIGIPIGVALALSIGGGYFQWCYLRGYRAGGTQRAALLESARAHTAYNATIVALVLVSVVLLAAGL